jgi:A/G-specific adenine glycosylase
VTDASTSGSTQQAEECLSKAQAQLRAVGQEHDGLYPWHRTSNPYEVLVAEYLLRKTTRVVAARVMPRVIQRYFSLAALAAADPDELLTLTREAGLRQRTLALIDIAKHLSQEGGVPTSEDALRELPFVGAYIAQAVLLYAFSYPMFPVDRGAQRVLLRVFKGVSPDKSDPARDSVLQEVVKSFIHGMSASEVRLAHQGVLSISWNHCRPKQPRCGACPLRTTCVYHHRPG